jgi:galactose mutarotase-like enzyme
MRRVHTVRESSVDGRAAVVLASPDGLAVTFVPGAGMVACSLTHHGNELLAQRGGLGEYVEQGKTFGLPLLYPWANRIDGLDYEVDGTRVQIDPERSPVRLDPNGLPNHGLLAGSPLWRVTGSHDGDAAGLDAELEFGPAPLLAAFPWPHVLSVEARLQDRTLTIVTHVRGAEPLPISFGWHPYLTLPGVPRADWEVSLGVRTRAKLDGRGIPTGETEPAPFTEGVLGERSFDDFFGEIAERPEFSVADGAGRIVVRFEAGYRCAQVYGPADKDLICFEPMTAPVNALQTGDRLTVAADYEARFSIEVEGEPGAP